MDPSFRCHFHSKGDGQWHISVKTYIEGWDGIFGRQHTMVFFPWTIFHFVVLIITSAINLIEINTTINSVFQGNVGMLAF
jgi:hypothetical protein